MRLFPLVGILLFFLTSISSLKAEDTRPLAQIRPIRGRELFPPTISRQLERLLLQIVSKQKEYELLLTGNDSPIQSIVEMVAIESNITKSTNGYKIDAKLLDIKSKRILSEVSHDNIREEDIVRLFQAAIEALFAPDKIFDSTPKPTIPNPSNKVNPPRVRVNTPDRYSLDFRKRVMDLKLGVDKEITKVNEKKIEDTKEELQVKKKEDLKQVAMKKHDLTVQKDLELPKPMPFYPRQHRITFGWESRSFKSTEIIETEAKATVISARAQGHIPLSYQQGKVAWSYDVGVGQASGLEYSIPVLYKLGVAATWLTRSWNISMGPYRENTFFVNLPEIGEGLQASELTITWAKINTEVDIRGWKLGGAYGTPFMAETDYAPLSGAKNWGGSYTNISLTPGFSWKQFQAHLMMENITLSNSEGERPFTHTESRYGLFVRRSL